mmetsp:Transcript_11513/g.19647  ORF Transcript_11513/g.19647 Transcript_11513/m.19647 type:complete len:296 (-) Transcript_11513:709-1596(-)
MVVCTVSDSLQQCVRSAQNIKLTTLHIHPLRNALFLLIQHLLLGLLKVCMHHLHAALAQSQKPRLRAHRLDVRPTQLVLRHHKLLQVHVVAERHPVGVDAEDAALGLDVRQRELYLAVHAPRAQQGGVQALDSVRCQNHLDVCTRIEAVHLVEELEHGTLDLALAAGGGLVALRPDRIDLVDEHDRRRQVVGHAEKFAHQLWPVSQVLLDELRAHDTQEGCRRGVCHRLCQQGLTGPRLPIQAHPLRRLDTNVFVKLRVGQGQLDRFFDLLNLGLESTNVRVRLQWSLLNLHDGD